jgi:hypothetical protein
MCKYVPSCTNVIATEKLQRCSACVGHEAGYEILPGDRHECLLGTGTHCVLEMKACASAVNCDTVCTCGTYRAVTTASVLSVRGENIDISIGGSEGTAVHVRTVGLWTGRHILTLESYTAWIRMERTNGRPKELCDVHHDEDTRRYRCLQW